jgi:hypothetical protein
MNFEMTWVDAHCKQILKQAICKPQVFEIAQTNNINNQVNNLHILQK